MTLSKKMHDILFPPKRRKNRKSAPAGYEPCRGSYMSGDAYSIGERERDSIRCQVCGKWVKPRRTIYGTITIPRHKAKD